MNEMKELDFGWKLRWNSTVLIEWRYNYRRLNFFRKCFEIQLDVVCSSRYIVLSSVRDKFQSSSSSSLPTGRCRLRQLLSFEFNIHISHDNDQIIYACLLKMRFSPCCEANHQFDWTYRILIPGSHSVRLRFSNLKKKQNQHQQTECIFY